MTVFLPAPRAFVALPHDLALLPTALDSAPATDPSGALAQFGAIGVLLAGAVGLLGWLFRRTTASNDARAAALVAALEEQLKYERERTAAAEVRADREATARDAQNRLLQEQALGALRDATKAVEINTRILEGLERDRAIEKAKGERGSP